jgi:hypothetical protein
MLPSPIVDGENKSQNLSASHRIKIATFLALQYCFPKITTVHKKIICNFIVKYGTHHSIWHKFKIANLSIYFSHVNFTTIRTVYKKVHLRQIGEVKTNQMNNFQLVLFSLFKKEYIMMYSWNTPWRIPP